MIQSRTAWSKAAPNVEAGAGTGAEAEAEAEAERADMATGRRCKARSGDSGVAAEDDRRCEVGASSATGPRLICRGAMLWVHLPDAEQ